MIAQPTINRIYSELRQQIVNRSIPPGSRLSESLLSKKWKVSRTPIREVLRRLESEGLVTCYPYRGAMVNTITIEDIEQLYAIRISLEGLAGRLATPIISVDAKKLKVLGKLCREMETLSRKNDIQGYIAKNNEFHHSICQSCGNKWLIKILENLHCQVNRFIVKALYVPHRLEKSAAEHWEIYEKLKTRKAKWVERAIQNNHKNALEGLKMEFVNR
jgi:DNA-binding GntR family transcriptional regulator